MLDRQKNIRYLQNSKAQSLPKFTADLYSTLSKKAGISIENAVNITNGTRLAMRVSAYITTTYTNAPVAQKDRATVS